MSVHVTGTINPLVTAPDHTEPESPFAAPTVDAGAAVSLSVGPYTNTSDHELTVSSPVVTNVTNAVVSSTTFTLDGSPSADPTTVPAGSVVTVEVQLTVDTNPTSQEYSFDVDATWS